MLDLVEIDRYLYESRLPLLDEAQLSQLSQKEINALADKPQYEYRQQAYIFYPSRCRDTLINDYY
jgi:hypothetical protein